MKPFQKLLNSDGKAIVIILFEGIEIDAAGVKPATSYDLPFFFAFPGSLRSFVQNYNLHGNHLAANIGNLEMQSLLNSVCLVAELDRNTEVSALDELHQFNQIAVSIAAHLWCTRDCAVNVDVGFMIERVDGGAIIVHKRTIRTYFYNSNGEALVKTRFGYKELKAAGHDSFTGFFLTLKGHGKLTQTIGTSRVKSLVRKDRFYYWVQDARKQDDLLTRISLYITALEALLSTSNSELAHQLSERVAFFLPNLNGVERNHYYRRMKRAYAFRSKGLHGDVIKSNEIPELNDLSEFLDEVCRRLQREIQENEEFLKLLENDEELNRNFNERLFIR